MCREPAKLLNAARAKFDELGVRLVVIAPGSDGVQPFIDGVWQGGDLFVDESIQFKYVRSHPRA